VRGPLPGAVTMPSGLRHRAFDATDIVTPLLVATEKSHNWIDRRRNLVPAAGLDGGLPLTAGPDFNWPCSGTVSIGSAHRAHSRSTGLG
jgi:hypothetical protein